MKAIVCSLFVFISLLLAAPALDIVTPTGTFRDVKVTRVEGEGVKITHSEGTALLDFDELPAAMQLEYGWTPEKSAARKAAKEAEVKRLEEEERMIDEAPKRKAAEEAAKKKAEEAKKQAEMEGQRSAERAANREKYKMEDAEGEKDLVVEAAKARAEIERERERERRRARGEPADEPVADLPVATIDPPGGPKKNLVVPPFGTVSSLLEKESIWTQHPKMWIGVGAAAAVVFLLFLLPSGKKKKLPRR